MSGDGGGLTGGEGEEHDGGEERIEGYGGEGLVCGGEERIEGYDGSEERIEGYGGEERYVNGEKFPCPSIL